MYTLSLLSLIPWLIRFYANGGEIKSHVEAKVLSTGWYGLIPE